MLYEIMEIYFFKCMSFNENFDQVQKFNFLALIPNGDDCYFLFSWVALGGWSGPKQLEPSISVSSKQ